MDQNPNYAELLRQMLIQELMHECRLSERQIKQMEWSQVGECSVKTRTGREAKISSTTAEALQAMPRYGRRIFVCPIPQNPQKPTTIQKIKSKIPRVKVSFKIETQKVAQNAYEIAKNY